MLICRSYQRTMGLPGSVLVAGPGSRNAMLGSFAATNLSIQGLTLDGSNIKGLNGIGFSGSSQNIVIENCRIFHCAHQTNRLKGGRAVALQLGVENVRIANASFTGDCQALFSGHTYGEIAAYEPATSYAMRQVRIENFSHRGQADYVFLSEGAPDKIDRVTVMACRVGSLTHGFMDTRAALSTNCYAELIEASTGKIRAGSFDILYRQGNNFAASARESLVVPSIDLWYTGSTNETVHVPIGKAD